MYNIVYVKVVDCTENLLDGLRRILFCELALLANAIEQLAASSKFRDNVVFVLAHQVLAVVAERVWVFSAYPGLEPVHKPDNVRVLQILEEVQLIVDHLLVALDILLQDDLDGDLASRAICFADNAVRACTKRAAETVLGPRKKRGAMSAD